MNDESMFGKRTRNLAEKQAWVKAQREEHKRRVRDWKQREPAYLAERRAYYEELLVDIERYAFDVFPRYEVFMDQVVDLVTQVGGEIRVIGESANGLPIWVVVYGEGEPFGKVNYIHPQEPDGVVDLYVDLRQCIEKPKLLRSGRRVSVVALDADGWVLQDWLRTPLSPHPDIAMMQYFFGMERPYDKAFEFMFHSNEREEFVQQFWGMPNETIAFSTFLQLYGTWTVTTNHGMAFAISPTWYSRPYAKGTTGELAVLADVAGYTLRPSEAEEKWQRVLKDPDFDDGVTLIAQNGIRDERTYWSAVAKQQGEDAQRNSYNSGKFTHMVGELHPMTSYIVSEHPLFAVEDLSGMPSFTKRQAYKAGIKELEKILRPVVSRFGENETSDNVMQYLLDSYTDDPGRYPIRRLFNSAAGQLKLPAMFLTSMRHDLATANDLDEPASESLVFDCLYFRPFYALSGLGMLRRSLQNLPREKSCPRVQRALEKTVGDQTGRICGDLKISITPVASRVLMMRGTSEVNERWTKKRLYSPDLSSYDSCVPVATDVFDVKDGALDKSVRHPLRAIDVGPPPVREYTTFAPQM